MFPPDNPLARLSHGDLMVLVAERDARIEELTRRVKWFENQLFGARTERRILQDAAGRQLFLAEMLEVPKEPPTPGTTVKAYERTQRRNPTVLMETDSRLSR